jgi:homoserine dehydrogenase
MSMGKSGRIGCTCFESKKILPIDEVESRYYIVMDVVDKPGVLAQIAGVFGRNIVSIESVIQKQREGRTDLVFILHKVKEKHVTRAIQELHDLEVVNKVLNCVRVEGPFIE